MVGGWVFKPILVFSLGQAEQQSSSSNKVGVRGLPLLVVQSRAQQIMGKSSQLYRKNFEKLHLIEDIISTKDVIEDIKVC